MRNIVATLFLFFIAFDTYSQDKKYAQNIVEILCSDSLAGRGYVRDGMGKSARFIKAEFEKNGLKPLPKLNGYFHGYIHSVNLFPGTMILKVDGKFWEPGKDYIIDPGSWGGKGNVKILVVNKDNIKNIRSKDIRSKALVIDASGIQSKDSLKAFYYNVLNESRSAATVIQLVDKLTWSVNAYVELDEVGFTMPISHLGKLKVAKKMAWEVGQELRKDFKAQNVVGYVEGHVKDTFVLVTAHYDHLGMMGSETYFRGASDNASGTSLMMDLAKHMAQEKPKYSTVFVAFGSEEIGLLGSKAFVEDQVVPLKQIKAVLNIDLMGGGSKGVTVVNATEYPDLFQKVKASNEEAGLSQIKERGEAANSDHYWFGVKGVPAIFIYTNGDVTAYHDIDDRPEGLKWVYYNELFTLMKGFLNRL